MGAWGYYLEDNDSSLDAYNDLIYNFLKLKIHYTDEDEIDWDKTRKSINFDESFYEKIRSFIKNSTNKKYEDLNLHNNEIIAPIYILLKNLHDSQNAQTEPSSHLPDENNINIYIPYNFPDDILNFMITSLKKEYNELEKENKQGWKNPNKRKSAIIQEINALKRNKFDPTFNCKDELEKTKKELENLKIKCNELLKEKDDILFEYKTFFKSIENHAQELDLFLEKYNRNNL